MSNSLETIRHKIASAEQLESVIRTMKAQAASSIGQYEIAIQSLTDYYHTIELGLTACFKQTTSTPINNHSKNDKNEITVIVFGSDQGMVGKFNEQLVDYMRGKLNNLSNIKIWAVGERVGGRLKDADLAIEKTFAMPSAIASITALIGSILTESIINRESGELSQMLIFYNCPKSGSLYEPICQQLLPIDAKWQHSLAQATWSTKNLPEIIADNTTSLLRTLIREYIFISLFKACAESLASENTSRLAAMQRAEKNIDELLENLKQTSHTLRKNSIDEELFDVIAGYELLMKN